MVFVVVPLVVVPLVVVAARRKPDAERVPVAPRKGLDRRLRIPGVDPSPQDGAVADPRPRRRAEGRDVGSGSRDAMGRVATGRNGGGGEEHIVTQHDVLTGD